MIIIAIAHQAEHVNADEVFGLIKERTQTMNSATVYPTPDMSVSQGAG